MTKITNLTGKTTLTGTEELPLNDAGSDKKASLTTIKKFVGSGTTVTPEQFGAIGDGVADDSAAVRAAVRFVGAAGGGKVVFTKTYLCNTGSENETAGGIGRAIIPIEYDNIHLEIQTGAVLLTTMSTTQYFILAAGTIKPNVAGIELKSIRDSQNYAGTFNSTNSTYTLYSISTAARWDNTVTLTTPSQHSNFVVGDWIFLRYGGTLLTSIPDGYDNPFAEYNQVIAKDTTTGVLTLLKPLKYPYSASVYPIGHNSAGVTVPWGIINMTRPNNVILQNFKCTGGGTIRMTGNDSHTIFVGNLQIRTHISKLHLDSSGQIYSWGLTDSYVGEQTHVTSGTTWGSQSLCNDAGNHNVVWHGIVAVGPTTSIHMHEGTTGNIMTGIVLTTTVPGPTNVASFRAYARDNFLQGIFFGCSNNASYPAIYCDPTTSDNTFDVHGQGLGMTVTAMVSDGGIRNTIRANRAARVDSTTGTIDGGLEHIFVSAPQFQGTVGAVPAVGGYSFAGMKLVKASNAAMSCSIMVPSTWRSMVATVHYINPASGTGNVVLQAGVEWATSGDNHYDASRFQFFGYTFAVPAQDIVAYATMSTTMDFENTTVSRPASDYTVGFTLTRASTDSSDTYANDIIVLGVDFRRRG